MDVNAVGSGGVAGSDAASGTESGAFLAALGAAGGASPPSQLAQDQHALQMWQLAGASYSTKGGQDQVPAGWSRLDDSQIKAMGLNPSDFHPQGAAQGFHAELFRSNDGKDTVLAFRGTVFNHPQDWVNNLEQGFGHESDYYSRAISLAQKVSAATRGDFEITGHSLGGGMAAAAGIVTGAKTTTFNAAGVSPSTVAPYHKTTADATKTLPDGRHLVDSYIVKGEILNDVQSSATPALNGLIGPIANGILGATGHEPQTAAGVQHYMPDPHPLAPFKPSVQDFLSPVALGADLGKYGQKMLSHAIDLHGGQNVTDALNNRIRADGGTP